MRKVTLIRGARQLLTLRGPSGPRRGTELGNLGIIQDGAVLIVDGLVREVGPSRRLENLAAAREADEIDASACVVMPGFVDTGAHLVSGPARVIDYQTRLGGPASEQVAFTPAERRWQSRDPSRIFPSACWNPLRLACLRRRSATAPRRWRPNPV
jgi:imidazolonepropionase-like amidohydrolase